MSPEQANYRSDLVTAASDIFALGAVLYELLCQRPAFRGATRDEIARQVIHRAPDPPRTINEHVPRGVEAICLTALAKNPEQRFKTAADMARALRKSIKPRRPVVPLSFALSAVALAAFIALFRPAAEQSDPLRVLEPLMDVERPGIQEPLRISEVRPHYRDCLTVKAEANREAYLWAFLYMDSGESRCLWPLGDGRRDPEKSNYVWLPHSNDLPVEIPRRAGVSLVLIVATQTPLSPDQFEQLFKLKPGLPEQLRTTKPSKPHAIVFPREGLDEPRYYTLRGGGSGDDDSVYRFPPKFQDQVHAHLPADSAFYAVMFSYIGQDPERQRVNDAE